MAVLYMKTDIHFWSYLAQFFLEWEMFQINAVEKIKTHILCSKTFLQKSWRLWNNVEIYRRAGQATDGSIIRRMRIVCWINKATHKHSEYVILISFPLQLLMHERALMLRHTCPACLVYCDFSSCRWFAEFRTPAREDAQRARQNVVHTASCLPATSRSYTNTNTMLRDHQILIDTHGNYSQQDH
jgi:hypothetical protein